MGRGARSQRGALTTEQMAEGAPPALESSASAVPADNAEAAESESVVSDQQIPADGEVAPADRTAPLLADGETPPVDAGQPAHGTDTVSGVSVGEIAPPTPAEPPELRGEVLPLGPPRELPPRLTTWLNLPLLLAPSFSLTQSRFSLASRVRQFRSQPRLYP
jgi:hypothetical protein